MSRQGSTHRNSKQLGLLSINFDHHLNCVVCGSILNQAKGKKVRDGPLKL